MSLSFPYVGVAPELTGDLPHLYTLSMFKGVFAT